MSFLWQYRHDECRGRGLDGVGFLDNHPFILGAFGCGNCRLGRLGDEEEIGAKGQ